MMIYKEINLEDVINSSDFSLLQNDNVNWCNNDKPKKIKKIPT